MNPNLALKGTCTQAGPGLGLQGKDDADSLPGRGTPPGAPGSLTPRTPGTKGQQLTDLVWRVSEAARGKEKELVPLVSRAALRGLGAAPRQQLG